MSNKQKMIAILMITTEKGGQEIKGECLKIFSLKGVKDELVIKKWQVFLDDRTLKVHLSMNVCICLQLHDVCLYNYNWIMVDPLKDTVDVRVDMTHLNSAVFSPWCIALLLCLSCLLPCCLSSPVCHPAVRCLVCLLGQSCSQYGRKNSGVCPASHSVPSNCTSCIP